MTFLWRSTARDMYISGSFMTPTEKNDQDCCPAVYRDTRGVQLVLPRHQEFAVTWFDILLTYDSQWNLNRKATNGKFFGCGFGDLGTKVHDLRSISFLLLEIQDHFWPWKLIIGRHSTSGIFLQLKGFSPGHSPSRGSPNRFLLPGRRRRKKKKMWKKQSRNPTPTRCQCCVVFFC